jgi:hypothetical protein
MTCLKFVVMSSGQGKTSLLMRLVDFVRKKRGRESAALLKSLRGICARNCGGETAAYLFDTGPIEDTFRMPDGSQRTEVYTEARNRIQHLEVDALDEWEEWSADKLDVSSMILMHSYCRIIDVSC